jgi:UDP-galactopyranose mutase
MLDLQNCQVLIVGAGFYGATMAECIVRELKLPVLLIDRREHIGGNSYTQKDAETGIEVHKYGSHIFHTNDETIWNYITRFTQFNDYRHKVFTTHQDNVYSMPINLKTIRAFYGKDYTSEQAEQLIEQERQKANITHPKNLEEKAISLIGRPLYEAFIKGYTSKQWEHKLTDLPESIITRLPVRFNENDFYFDDKWQGIPLEGYTKVFERMLDHELIDVKLGVDWREVRDHLPKNCYVIYSGPIDLFFDYKFGRLNWRTLDFEETVRSVGDFQGTTVMNYADLEIPYTRIHEFRHYHPERTHYPNDKTITFTEFSRMAGEHDIPYYPVNTQKDKEALKSYEQLAKGLSNVHLGGRLGSYKYYDMHQVIGQALAHFKSKVSLELKGLLKSA